MIKLEIEVGSVSRLLDILQRERERIEIGTRHGPWAQREAHHDALSGVRVLIDQVLAATRLQEVKSDG
jgi:hypothetical protein